MAAAMRYRALVRCGNLAAEGRQINPESLAGLCGQVHRPSIARLPSQGPAPLSTWGFSLAKRFCVASTWMDTLPAGNREDGKESRKMARRTTLRCQREYHGISAFLFTGLAGYSWNQAQQATQSRFPDRTPRVSGEPEWAAREKTPIRQLGRRLCRRGATPSTSAAWFDSRGWGRLEAASRDTAQWTSHLLPNGVGGGFAWTYHHRMKYGAKDNEIADRIRGSQQDFLYSPEWREMRRMVIGMYGSQCMKCKKTPKRARDVHVDHIKARTRFPELKLDLGNLQVLCCRCNKAKGNSIADYR